MRTVKALLSNWLFVVVSVSLLGWLTTAPIPAQAQNCNATLSPGCQGWNGVYLTSNKSPSYAFVDAVPYLTDSRCPSGGCDICDTIGLALMDYNYQNSNGVLIDARGVPTPQYCTSGTGKYPNPWGTIAVPAKSYNNTVLLPVGTIYLETTWALTTDTRLIGEGANLTTLQVCTTAVCGQVFSSADHDMIDMGTSSICPGTSDCTGVVIEHLGLNGNGVANINGIVNSASQELSRVENVAMSNIAGTGLTLSTKGAANSGPYANIEFFGTGTCANISGTVITRGIHGLTCNLSGSSAGAAILLDGPNNTLEDISIL